VEAITVPINSAAKALGISRVTLYKLINSGSIETIRVGSRRLVRVDSLRRFAGADQVAA
jgi:excisionase family DNA binding protein